MSDTEQIPQYYTRRPALCDQCRELYEPTRRDQKFCSTRCGHRFRYLKNPQSGWPGARAWEHAHPELYRERLRATHRRMTVARRLLWQWATPETRALFRRRRLLWEWASAETRALFLRRAQEAIDAS